MSRNRGFIFRKTDIYIYSVFNTLHTLLPTSMLVLMHVKQPVTDLYTYIHIYIKVKLSRYRPGVAQRVPGI